MRLGYEGKYFLRTGFLEMSWYLCASKLQIKPSMAIMWPVIALVLLDGVLLQLYAAEELDRTDKIASLSNEL